MIRYVCCEAMCFKSMLGNHLERDEKTSPPPSTRWGLPRSMSVRPSLCVSWFPHSIAMYGTQDDVLSPGPYAHLPQSRSPYRLSTEVEAGIVMIDNNDNQKNNENDNMTMSCEEAPLKMSSNDVHFFHR